MGAIKAMVLSGKGGTGKTSIIQLMAGEASRIGLRVLLVDTDPERNLSNRHKVPQHSTGIGDILTDAGILNGEPDPEKGAKRLDAELRPSRFENVDLLPAGASLGKVSAVPVEADDLWLLAEVFDAAQINDRYDFVGIDSGGRTGSLSSMGMYAADTAFAPVWPTSDAIRKAKEARTRVEKIQRAHPLRWAGVVMLAFDKRVSADDAIRADAYEVFGDQVRAEIPRRAVVHEAFQVGDRLGDRRDVEAQHFARVFRGFLLRDLMGRDLPADITAAADGVLR